MSILNKLIFDKVRNSKSFNTIDIVLYGITFIIIAVLFILFVILPRNNSSLGFKVEIDNQRVLTYEFENNRYIINESFADNVIVQEKDDEILFSIYTNKSLDKFNVVWINTAHNKARIIESNCSSSKDCVHSPEIEKSGAVVCAPHKLTLSPLVGGSADQPITG